MRWLAATTGVVTIAIVASAGAATTHHRVASSNVPAASSDPWSVTTDRDEMSGAATPQAEAEITSSDGRRFSITTSCDRVQGNSSVSIEVLGGGDTKYQVIDNSTISGNGVSGYRESTTSHVSVRLRFDEGAVTNSNLDVSYNNDFKLLFLDQQKLQSAARAGGEAGFDAGLANGLLKFAGIFGYGAAGDVTQLVYSDLLRIQPTLANGGAPIIRLPLTNRFKRFVMQCAFPERLAAFDQPGSGMPHRDSAGLVQGTYQHGDPSAFGASTLVFKDGLVTWTIGGRALPPSPYSIQGQDVVIGSDIHFTIVDRDTLLAKDGNSAQKFIRVEPVP